MNVQELKKELAKGEQVELIDVREKDEFAQGDKIPGSKNVPMGQMFVDAAGGRLPKDKKIVTICKSGKRCEIVANELKKSGYNIEHLEGGVNAWETDGAAHS
ncbi:rhodanese-like domain-containing protein [Patescibacteria group bacterium]|nr:rhodanese-like domain-containing protein [Patescibacteria group bacterium]